MRSANSAVGDRGGESPRSVAGCVTSFAFAVSPLARRSAPGTLGVLGVLALALAACSSDPEPAPPRTCTTVDLACTPAYEPTYANVFAKTLQPTCGKSGASCHSSSGRQGGLAFEDPNVAYDDMMAGKITPGDAACSTVVYRIAATDGKIRMPPGRQLETGEQCAIAQWIQNGAKK